MLKGERLASLLKRKELTQKDFAKEVGLSEVTVNSIITKSKGSIESIEKIADYFNLPIDYFFERNIQLSQAITGNGNRIQNGDGNVMIENQAKEIEHLQQLLAEKERTIQILMAK